MQELELRLLYGIEFWDTLEQLLKSSQQRVFLISAYIGQSDYIQYSSYIPISVFKLTMCRSDNNRGKYFPPNAIIVDKGHFHGKMYLIDNTVIIGSQNLLNARKEGEFSVMITTDYFNASLIIYQALIKIIERLGITSEPVDSDFLQFYSDCCPFCGNTNIPDPTTMILCPGYGSGLVSEADCEGYGEEGSCKYCIPENRQKITECYFCDDSGCGFGISGSTLKLVHHAINPLTGDELHKAKNYLSLFNFFKQKKADAIEIFKNLGFNGDVFSASLKREGQRFVNQ